MGTAYKTPIPASVYTTATDNAAVYAIYPPAEYGDGLETTHVIVATSVLAGDTVIYPCDDSGHMVSFELVSSEVTQLHRTALRRAGWDLELAVPRGA